MKISGRFDDSPIKIPLWTWCLLGLVFWQVLLWAQPPSILMDDSGEMVAASWNLGLPHPPGYPLFDLLGHLFSWLPVGAVAFRFGLISSLVVLLSLAFILKTCAVVADKLTLNKKASGYLGEALLVVAALFFLSCQSVFSQCLSAKGCIYTLTLLIISVLIRIRVSKLKESRVIYAAWFLWGLGLANHWQTVILLVPFMIFLTVQKQGFTVKNTLFFCFFTVLGISLYLYLPLRAALLAQPSWGFPLNWTDFKWVVSRQLVGGEEMKIHSLGFYGGALTAMARSFQLWIPGVAALAVLGLWVVYRIEKNLTRDFFILFSAVVLALAGVHEANNLYLMPVYLTVLSGLVVLLSFAGLFWLLSKGGRPFQKTMAVVLLLFSFFWCWSSFEMEDRSRYTLAEDFGVNVLKCLPKNAVLLADGDNYVMPLWYVKYVDRLRPDVIVEPTVFLYHEWGWSQLGLQAGDLKQTVPSKPPFTERFIGLIKNQNHPFFYSFGRQFFPGGLDRIGHWAPHGLVNGWTSSSLTAGDDSKSQRMSGLERFRGIDENREAEIEDPPTTDLYASYAMQGMNESTWYLNHNDGLKALSQLESALYFQPQWPGVYASMASIVGSMGYWEMARNICQMSIQANPKVGLNYAVLARIDEEQGRYLESNQEKEKARSLGYNPQWATSAITLLEKKKESGKIQDKSPAEYRNWSEILEKSGCPFLSRLAFQCSEKGMKSLN